MQTLKNLRSERGLSTSDLAKRAKIARGTVWQLEEGNTSPTLRTLEKLASALGCEVSDLIPERAEGGRTRIATK